MIKAVIFDMDGVLIDSEPFWRQSEIAVLNSLGLKITEADTIVTMGLRIDEVVRYWFERHPWEGQTHAQISQKIISEVIWQIDQDGTQKPGVIAALEFFKARGLRICLATSSSTQIINAVLSKLKLGEFFEFTQSAEHEEFGKPHPAVYLSAIEKLGLLPHECVAIEDSPAGVEAAKRAGAYCICIPDKLLDKQRVKGADYILPSLEAITAEHLKFSHLGN